MKRLFLVLCASFFVLSGCTSSFQPHQETPIGMRTEREQLEHRIGRLGGGDGLFNELLRRNKGGAGGTGIGVNAYLWQASLDTLAFMPLSSADSFGGIIITDWYSPDAESQSRYKVNVYIIGRELRATALRVAAFKQTLVAGSWSDVEDASAINAELEDTILTKARQLRIDVNEVTE